MNWPWVRCFNYKTFNDADDQSIPEILEHPSMVKKKSFALICKSMVLGWEYLVLMQVGYMWGSGPGIIFPLEFSEEMPYSMICSQSMLVFLLKDKMIFHSLKKSWSFLCFIFSLKALFLFLLILFIHSLSDYPINTIFLFQQDVVPDTVPCKIWLLLSIGL